MDSEAYLKRHGWPGLGHSLHPTGRGIKKPLLISKKPNVLGVGTKQNDIYADQWWSRAFDSSLKNLEVNKNETTGTIEAVKESSWGSLELLKSGGGKWAGLYNGFVRGKALEGTFSPEEEQPPPELKVDIETPEPSAVTKVSKKSRKKKQSSIDHDSDKTPKTNEATQPHEAMEANESNALFYNDVVGTKSLKKKKKKPDKSWKENRRKERKEKKAAKLAKKGPRIRTTSSEGSAKARRRKYKPKA